MDQLASNSVDPYFGILKPLFFQLPVPRGGPASLLAPVQTGRRPAGAGQAPVWFWPRSIHSFLAAALAPPQPSFGVLKRTSRCKSPRWQPRWRSSALRTADCASVKHPAENIPAQGRGAAGAYPSMHCMKGRETPRTG